MTEGMQPQGGAAPQPQAPAQAQPGWPPPAVGAPGPTGWPPPAVAAASAGPSTSVLVVVAGLFLLLAGIVTAGFGALVGLLGGLIATAGSARSGLEIFGPIGGLVAGLAILVVLWGLLEAIAAIGMLVHRGWGRALGLVTGVVGFLFTGLGLLGVAGSGDSGTGGLAFSVVFVAGYALTVVALVTGGAHFRRRA